VKTFVDWVLSQRYWLVLIAIAFTPILPMVTAGLMVLNTLHRGTSEGAATAAAGSGVLALLAVATAGAWLDVAAVGACAMLGGAALGAILNWGGTLTIGFQGTVLASWLVALAITLLGPDPATLVAPVVERVRELLETGDPAAEQLDLVQGWDTMLLGLVFAAVFAQLVGALLLGYWWFGLARAQVRFGEEFRALKLGRVLGIPAIILVTLGLLFQGPLVQAPLVHNLAPIAVFAFLFQGAAVMHAWAHAKKWHPAAVWPVYIVLITPLTMISILGLSAVGLIDNVFELRAPLRARE